MVVAKIVLEFQESSIRMNFPTELQDSHVSDERLGIAKLCIIHAPTEDGRLYVVLQIKRQALCNWGRIKRRSFAGSIWQ
jgi:hypothetical protein